MIKIGTTRNAWDKALANFLHTELSNLHVENHLVYFESEKMIENALLNDEIDVFVRPLRDLPTEMPLGMTIGALSHRVDPAVFLIRLRAADDDTGGGHILGLPADAKILAKTEIYAQQFADLGFNFQFCIENLDNPIQNIDYLKSGEFNAVLTSKHVVHTLELDESEFEIIRLQPREIIPEIGQGVVAALVRTDDLMLRKLVQKLHNPLTAEQTNVERTVQKMYRKNMPSIEVAVFCERDNQGYFHVAGFDGRGRRVRLSSGTHFQLAETIFAEFNT